MAAMESLEQVGPIVSKELANEIIDAQADEACADGTQRNGHRKAIEEVPPPPTPSGSAASFAWRGAPCRARGTGATRPP